MSVPRIWDLKKPENVQYTGAGIDTDRVLRAYTWQSVKQRLCNASTLSQEIYIRTGHSRHRADARVIVLVV